MTQFECAWCFLTHAGIVNDIINSIIFVFFPNFLNIMVSMVAILRIYGVLKGQLLEKAAVYEGRVLQI